MSSKGSKSESISMYSLSLPKSVTEQTKDRFDAIFKSALKKKKSQSKEKLLDEKASTSASSANLVDEEIEEEIQDEIEFVENYESDDEEKESKNYMLSKFLNDTSQEEVTVIKPPVPKPTTKLFENDRRGSLSSVGTYKVEESKISKKRESTFIQIEPRSRGNTATNIKQTVENPRYKDTKIQIDPEPSEYDNDKIKTRPTNVIQSQPTKQEIGELVLHDSPIDTKIKIVASQNSPKEILEKADHETLSDNTDNELSSRTSSSRQTFTVNKNKKSKKDNNEEILENKYLDSKSNASLEDSEEESLQDIKSKQEIKKPKPTTRKKLNKNETKDADIVTPKHKETNYNHIVEIIIHKTDKLMLNSFIIHPVVKIHIVDIKTGKYYKKSDKSRSVVFYYENDTNDYILPVMSGYCNLQEKRTLYPIWEETILLNEDFDYLVNENVLIFFEILDFVPSNTNSHKKRKDFDKGWLKIAFAFLKLVGKNNALNINKQVRLQLFFPPDTYSKNCESDKCPLFDHWQSKKMKKFPSTLYVTVKQAISPKKVIDTFRSKSALQREEITSEFKQENQQSEDLGDHLKEDIENFKSKWLKKDKITKHVPDDCLEKIETDEDGCFVIKFSHEGQYLACSVKIADDFCVLVLKVENFEEKTRFKNHQELIYAIVWSLDDKLILTASADNTVAVWDFENHSFLQILPHPNFVYAADVTSKYTVASGCYDKIIRIWKFNQKNQTISLAQELEGHQKYVTSLCFSKKNEKVLYSADARGEIFEWEMKDKYYSFKRKIEIVDLKETVINQIILFANEKKMLVHSRDSALRIISLANNCVVHWLYGALNSRAQTFCDISPCSSYVICGSENGLVLVWDAKTGKDIKTYQAYPNKSKTVHSVQFHPRINMFSVSHYGSNEPILIYGLKNEQGDVNNKKIEKREAREENETIFKEKKIDFRRILRKMDELLID